MSRPTRTAGRALSLACVCGLAVMAGCSNAGQGAVTGAGLGAAGGAIIGSIFGSAGSGAAIGAVSGAVAGGVIGDQNQRREHEARLQRSTVHHHHHYDVVESDPYRHRDRYIRRHGGR